MPETDLEIIRHYAKSQSAEEFSEIVKRYDGLVYSTCLRIHGDPHQAQDSAQECFFKLARNAEQVNISLAGWLHRCATYVSLQRKRSESSLRARESHYAAAFPREKDDTGIEWSDVAPFIDEALDELPENLRHCVVEHFLHRRTLDDIAAEMGISHSTASRRVHRGVDKVRKSLKKKGIVATVGMLFIFLTGRTASAVPQALTSALGRISIVGATKFSAAPPATLAGGKAAGILSFVVKSKITAAILLAAILGVGGLTAYRLVAAGNNNQSPAKAIEESQGFVAPVQLPAAPPPPAAAAKSESRAVRRAVVIAFAGGGAGQDKIVESCVSRTLAILSKAGFADSSITLFSREPASATIVHYPTTEEAIFRGLSNLASTVREDDELWTFIFGHANVNARGLSLNTQGTRMRGDEFAGDFNKIRCRHFIFCLNRLSAGLMPLLRREGRIIVTATTSEQQMAAPKFTDNLLTQLEHSPTLTILEAVTRADMVTRSFQIEHHFLYSEIPQIFDGKELYVAPFEEIKSARLSELRISPAR